MNKSESIAALAKALAAAQGEIQNAKKSEENPFYKSRYADLAAVRESIQAPFAKNGLAVIQLPATAFLEDGVTVSVETILTHASGEWVSGEVSARPTKTDPQGIGSAITYLRRYALSAIAGVASEQDDDGNAASQPAPAKTAQPKTQAGTELAALKQAAVDACKVLNQAGDTPEWTAKRLNEFATAQFGQDADRLPLQEMRLLVLKLSDRIDVVKKGKKDSPLKASREAKIAELLKSNTEAEITDAMRTLGLDGDLKDLSLDALNQIEVEVTIPF